MTLKRFYTWVKSECKEKRHTVSSYNIPLRRCRATGWLLRQRSSQSDLIRYTHLTHTRNPCLLKMQIQFSRQGKRANTYGDLCQPRHSVSAPANRLVLCDRANSCSGVEARWPGRYALVSVVQTGCFSQFNLEFNEHLPAFCLHSPSLWLKARWDFLQTVNVHRRLQYNWDFTSGFSVACCSERQVHLRSTLTCTLQGRTIETMSSWRVLCW